MQRHLVKEGQLIFEKVMTRGLAVDERRLKFRRRRIPQGVLSHRMRHNLSRP
jgi:hypothetical protein